MRGLNFAVKKGWASELFHFFQPVGTEIPIPFVQYYCFGLQLVEDLKGERSKNGSKKVNIILFSIQRAKKVESDSPELVDFAIGLVNSMLNLPDGQVKIFRRIKIAEVL